MTRRRYRYLRELAGLGLLSGCNAGVIDFTGADSGVATGGSASTIVGGSSAGGLGGASAVSGFGGGFVLSGGASAVTAGGTLANGGVANTGGMTEPVSTVVGPPAVDVLLMIDNSASMADKQQLLASSIPRLVERLVLPNCVDASGAVVGKSQFGVCAQGTAEFKAVNNLHMAVITSSLGDHGGNNLCTPGLQTPFTDPSGNVLVIPDDANDKAHLIASSTRGVSALAADTSIVQSDRVKIDAPGFLAWSSASQVPTTTDVASATSALRDMVTAVGESGCGLESQLESWFRFLIDPVPPIMPITKPDGAMAERLGSDDVLLAQRAAFLRPNSTLAIVMLTDENDCSLRDTDVGWVTTNTAQSLIAASTQCAINPNDPCCYSCTNRSPPTGCASGCPDSDLRPTAADDSPYQANLRCWNEKRRFGYEFLYPVSRYVVGLTKPRLCPDQTFGDMDCECTYAKAIGADCGPGARNLPNPLFSSIVGTNNSGSNVLAATNVAPRTDASSVYLAGILGVPWQDIGRLDASGNLVYIPVTDPAWSSSAAGSVTPITPAPNGIWSNIYGDDNANIVPADVHMVESIVPRPGLPAPGSATDADPINGHEWNTAYGDLQYACTFALPTPRACSCDPSTDSYSSCKYQSPNDCCDLTFSVDGRGNSVPGSQYQKPLCAGNTQVAAKAYPGLREIAVLRDYALSSNAAGRNSVVTSICAKDATGDPASPGYGYNPAIDALVGRMKERL